MQKIYQKRDGIIIYPEIYIKIAFESSSSFEILFIEKNIIRNIVKKIIAIKPQAKNKVKNDKSSSTVISFKELINISKSPSESFDIAADKEKIEIIINIMRKTLVIKEEINPNKYALYFSIPKRILKKNGKTIEKNKNINPSIKGPIIILYEINIKLLS
jgi:hypothetical protein